VEPAEPSLATRLQLSPSQDFIVGPNPAVVLNTTYYEGQRADYARTTNSTWEAFEALIGDAEGGVAISFASGMAALSTLVLTFAPKVLLMADGYMGTRVMVEWLSRRLAGVRAVEPGEFAGALEQVEPGTLVVIETPSNPLLTTYSIREIAAAVHVRQGLLAVDSTLATPVLQRPLGLGADIVVHSASKFLAGHSDVLGGVLVARDDELAQRLLETRSLLGGVIGPVEAYLCFRGLRTLALRVKHASRSAQLLAERVRERTPLVVRYPGFDTELVGPGRQQELGGAVVAVELPSAAVADAFVEHLSIFHHATSLGGVESLAERRSRYPQERHVPEGLVRLSIGLEDPEDLWADLVRALRAVGIAPVD
jgi:cystathionine gamma-synthase